MPILLYVSVANRAYDLYTLYQMRVKGRYADTLQMWVWLSASKLACSFMIWHYLTKHNNID